MQQSAKGERIKDIATNGLGKKFADTLNEITLITGLKPPFEMKKDKDAKEYEDVSAFALMFTQFLRNHYGIITLSEVVLAFRLNASGDLPGTTNGKHTDKIDFFGLVLTLEHLGGVLYRYMQKRAKLAAKINEQRVELEEPKPSDEEIEMNNKEFANEYYRKYLNKEFSSASIEYAHLVYDVLDSYKVLQLSTEDKHRIFAEAQSIRDKELAAPPASREEKKDRLALIESYLNDAVPIHEQGLVKSYAKRLALLEAFGKWKESGKTKIFDI